MTPFPKVLQAQAGPSSPGWRRRSAGLSRLQTHFIVLVLRLHRGRSRAPAITAVGMRRRGLLAGS